jgi:tRNA threonylcarbamoyladenosine biosynthesis protein TsaE
MSILEALKSGVTVHSAEAMEALGRGIVREIFPNGGTIALQGDLGAGKTTLVRGMAAALGIDNVTSPSFNYYFLYPPPRKATADFVSLRPNLQLLHLDAYRLNSPGDYPSLMIDEFLTKETLFVIEWPEKLGRFLPKEAMRLELKIIGKGVHRVGARVG